ncbi:MAG: sigma 54-interacting transcriptional regulator [Deltaproteobacteria bacterium]|jgi:arginine utilization regulatory protein|nr:sigma 54-interacting transcriptional regulator [Deltaproteobacteria bacterium]
MTKISYPPNHKSLISPLELLVLSPLDCIAIFDKFPLGVIFTDTYGKIIYCNNAQGEIDDVNPEEIVNRFLTEALEPTDGPDILFLAKQLVKPLARHPYAYNGLKGREIKSFCWSYPILKDYRLKGYIIIVEAKTPPEASEETLSAALEPEPLEPVEIIGQNAGLLRVMGSANAYCDSPLPILLSGPEGAGKRLLAKKIHLSSQRKDKPFLALNCATLPRGVIETILFGETDKAIGPCPNYPGVLASAKGGTIYLANLEGLPLDNQAQLLSALEEKRVYRDAARPPIGVDAKIIASLNLDPKEALVSGKLSKSLFYSLGRVHISLPPLSERVDDLYSLSVHLLRKHSAILERRVPELDPSLLWQMEKYQWPGNVDELEHLLVSGLINSHNDSLVSLRHLTPYYADALTQGTGSFPYRPSRISKKGEFPFWIPDPPRKDPEIDEDSGYLSKVRDEARTLKTHLYENQGNVTKAAEKMGISRQLLSYRLKKFGINAGNYR